MMSKCCNNMVRRFNDIKFLFNFSNVRAVDRNKVIQIERNKTKLKIR